MMAKSWSLILGSLRFFPLWAVTCRILKGLEIFARSNGAKNSSSNINLVNPVSLDELDILEPDAPINSYYYFWITPAKSIDFIKHLGLKGATKNPWLNREENHRINLRNQRIENLDGGLKFYSDRSSHAFSFYASYEAERI